MDSSASWLQVHNVQDKAVAKDKQINDFFPPEALSCLRKKTNRTAFLFVNSVKRRRASESPTCRRGETRTCLFFILFSGFETRQRLCIHLKLSVLESLLSLRSELQSIARYDALP